MDKLIKVASRSESSMVAGAIVGVLRERKHAEIQAIGANAVNQAVKAIAIARSYLDNEGLDLSMLPSFTNVQINGADHTALRFHVELCQRGTMIQITHRQEP